MRSAIILVVAMLCTAVTTGLSLAQGRAASVLVEEVDVRAITDTSPTLGQLVPSTQADVASRRAGVAAEVLFEVGDRVTMGEPMVRLETRLTEIERRNVEADLEVARSGIATAEAALTLARQVLARQERLKGSTAFQQGIFEDRTAEVARVRGLLGQAMAQAAAAEARMARVDYDLEHAIIKAPFTGVVVERMAQPGQYLTLGEAIAKLLDVAGLEIEADVPSDLVTGLTPSTVVAVDFAGGVSGKAKVRVALPVETVSTRTRPVRFQTDLTGIDPQLIAVGKSLTLHLPVSAPREVITVPKDALVQGRGGGWIVYAVVDGVAEVRPVTLGQSAEGRLEVLDGLAAGDLVVVRGNERLRPGQQVNASPAGG
ncbi:MAG: efflux RND transporter periplasmic adaptor subunit [Pseudomonadota bacterium]